MIDWTIFVVENSDQCKQHNKTEVLPKGACLVSSYVHVAEKKCFLSNITPSRQELFTKIVVLNMLCTTIVTTGGRHNNLSGHRT